MPRSVSSADVAREARVRRLDRRRGFALRKDRARTRSLDHAGGYMIISMDNWIVAGQRFDLDLEQVEEFLKDES